MTTSKISKVVVMLENASMNSIFFEKSKKDFIIPFINSVYGPNLGCDNLSQESLSECFVGVFDGHRMEIPRIEFTEDSFKCSPENLETDARGSVSDGLAYALELCDLWSIAPQNMSRVPMEKHILLVSGIPPDENVSGSSINHSGLNVNALVDVISMNQILLTVICPKNIENMYESVDQNVVSNSTLTNSSPIDDDIAVLDNFNHLVSRLTAQRNAFKNPVQGGTSVHPQTLDLPLPPISNEPSQQEQIKSLQKSIEAMQMLILEYEEKMAKLKHDLEWQKLQQQQTAHPVTHHQPAEDYSEFTDFEMDYEDLHVNMDASNLLYDLDFTEDESLQLMCGASTAMQTDVASSSVGAGPSCLEFPTPERRRPFTVKVAIDFLRNCINHWPIKFKSIKSSLKNFNLLPVNHPHHNMVKIFVEHVKKVSSTCEKRCLKDLAEEYNHIHESILNSKVKYCLSKDFRAELKNYVGDYQNSKQILMSAHDWSVDLICLDEQLQNLQEECEVIHGILEFGLAPCTSNVIYRGEAYEVKCDNSQVTLVDIPYLNSFLTWGMLVKRPVENEKFLEALKHLEKQQNADLREDQSPSEDMF